MSSYNTQYKNPLGYEKIGKLLRKFALPSIAAMLINAVYNIVDQIFIGQGIGYLGNAATTVSFPIVSIIMAVGALLGAGGSAYAAIKLGEKKENEAEEALGNVFVLLVISGIIITVLGLLFLEPIMKVFGATPKNMGYSKDYASIIFMGTIFSLLGMGLTHFCRTDGSPTYGMISILIGAILNTILDPIYIFIFHWGVKGAAIATITSQIISACMLLWYFFKKGRMRFRLKYMKLNFDIIKKIVTLGVSSCVIGVANTIVQIIMNNSLVIYGNQSSVTGDVALSAMGIVLKVNMILISICVGIGLGSQPILGFNKGANKPKRIRETYLKAIITASIISISWWVFSVFFPDIMLKAFGTSDSNFTQFAIKCMRTYLGGIFIVGFQITSINYFQATGQPVKASALSMLRQILALIPLILIFPRFFGLDGILYAGVVADLFSGCMVSIFIIIEMKKLNLRVKTWEENERIESLVYKEQIV